ncbi:MAG TPA: hypothetical protein VGM85_10150 [Paraburkholderia sp.]
MSSRHDKERQFEPGLPEQATPECSSPAPGSDTAMHELQLASEVVMQLATQIHAAVARNDMTGAQAARAALEQQLKLTTSLIDELLFGGHGQPAAH